MPSRDTCQVDVAAAAFGTSTLRMDRSGNPNARTTVYFPTLLNTDGFHNCGSIDIQLGTSPAAKFAVFTGGT